MRRQFSVHWPKAKELRPALVIWLLVTFVVFGAPLVASWGWPGALPYTALGPLVIPLLGYVYFPWALSKLRVFGKHNTFKSIVVGILGYELYRQALVWASPTVASAAVGQIRQRCAASVETFSAFVPCAASVFFTVALFATAFFFVPALLLATVRTSQTTAGEALYLPSDRS